MLPTGRAVFATASRWSSPAVARARAASPRAARAATFRAPVTTSTACPRVAGRERERDERIQVPGERRRDERDPHRRRAAICARTAGEVQRRDEPQGTRASIRPR
jgi:hypothetical protein